jgi:hypothetical protein
MAVLLQYLQNEDEKVVEDYLRSNLLFTDAYNNIKPERGARTKHGINSNILLSYVDTLKELY